MMLTQYKYLYKRSVSDYACPIMQHQHHIIGAPRMWRVPVPALPLRRDS